MACILRLDEFAKVVAQLWGAFDAIAMESNNASACKLDGDIRLFAAKYWLSSTSAICGFQSIEALRHFRNALRVAGMDPLSRE